jgi:hypothetical protein
LQSSWSSRPTPETTATCHPESTGSHARRPEADISFFTRLLFAAYFLEAGLILLIAPWTDFWTGNLFVDATPAMRELLGSHFVRGGVSGIGAVTALAGIAELATAIISRHSGPAAPDVEA